MILVPCEGTRDVRLQARSYPGRGHWLPESKTGYKRRLLQGEALACECATKPSSVFRKMKNLSLVRRSQARNCAAGERVKQVCVSCEPPTLKTSTSTRPPSPPTHRSAGGGDRVRGALRAARPPRPRLRRQDRRLPRLGAARVRRALPGLVARPPAPRAGAVVRAARRVRHGGRLAAGPRDPARGRDRRPHRAWKIHWMLNFAQFSSTTALNATIEAVRGEADPGLMGRLQSSVEDRNWDSIEDLWKMKEEIAGDDELRALFEGDTAADILRGARGLRARPPVRRREAQAASAGLRLQGDLVARVRVQDLGREPGADHRGGPRLPRDGLRLPGEHQGRRRRPRAGQGRGHGGRRGRGARAAPAGARPVAGHEPAHARPPLLHRPGRQRARPARGHRDRPQARRGRRARRPRGRRLPPLQRAAAADGRPGARSTRASSSPTGATSRRRRTSAAAVVGRHRHRGGARVPVQRAVGLPREVLRGRAGHDRRGQGPGRVARRDRGAGALRVVARRVRPGRAGGHPRLPDDEPRLGRAVHEDLRARDGGRRRRLAPGGRRARVRDPGRGRDQQRGRAHQDRATGSA